MNTDSYRALMLFLLTLTLAASVYVAYTVYQWSQQLETIANMFGG